MRLALVLLALATSAPLAAAQPTADRAAPTVACAYDECAIRLEQGFFGTPTILVGPPGAERRLGSAGALGGGLVDAVGAVPAAREHADASRRDLTKGLVFGIAGAAALLAGIAVTDSRISNLEDTGTTEVVLLAGGLGLAVTSTVFALRGRREQSRAVWAYNRAVAAGQPVR